jgi:hypothetical protein
MPQIPIELFRQIDKAPTHRLQADQWFETGYVLVDGVVHRYFIDRKDQYDSLEGSWPLQAFLASDAPAEALAWAARAGSSDARG